MVLSEVRKPTDAVVTVSKDLYPQLVILLLEGLEEQVNMKGKNVSGCMQKPLKMSHQL